MMKKEWLLILLLLVIGLALRLNNLCCRSLWTDEFFTLFQASGHGTDIKLFIDSLAKDKPPRLLYAGELKRFMRLEPSRHLSDVITGIRATDTHPPFYFGVIYLWMRVFSDNPLAVRSFSLLMGIISIMLAYRLGSLLFSKREGFFCGLFVSVCAFCVCYSQEARSYSLVMALGLLSGLLLLRLERHNKKSDALAFSVINAAGIYTHYFYIFIAFSQFAYFTFSHHRETGLLRRFYLFFMLSLLFLSPWVILLFFKGYNFYLTEWIFGYPGILEKLRNLLYGFSQYLFIFYKPSFGTLVMLSAGFAWFLYCLWLSLADMRKRYPQALCFCLHIFIIPILGMLFIDIIEKGALLKQERFWVFPFLGFIPLAGYTLSRSFSKNRLVTILFIIGMVSSSWPVSSLYFGPAPQRASQWINQQSRPGESCVIIYGIRSVMLSQAYYLDDRIKLLPVLKDHELTQALGEGCASYGKVFICRHYHRTDSSLMDQPFMEAEGIEKDGFVLEEASLINDISVFEYKRR